MTFQEIKNDFEKYIILSYNNIIYLQYIKNMLIKKLDDENFMSLFQKDSFSLLSSYFLLLHNAIVLEICKISDDAKYEDDYTLRKFLKTFLKNTFYDVEEDKKVIEIIFNNYNNARNKKIAHFTTLNFTENKKYEKNGQSICIIEHKDLFPFCNLDKDIIKIGKIVEKYANLLDIKIESVLERQESKYTNFPEITPDFIRKKQLFAPLF